MADRHPLAALPAPAFGDVEVRADPVLHRGDQVITGLVVLLGEHERIARPQVGPVEPPEERLLRERVALGPQFREPIALGAILEMLHIGEHRPEPALALDLVLAAQEVGGRSIVESSRATRAGVRRRRTSQWEMG